MTKPTTAVIADDHTLVRRGTREILQQDPRIQVLGEAASGAELMELMASTTPAVAVVDIGLPDMSGIDATALIKSRWPDVGVVILTIHDDEEYVWTAIQAGASGYLLKDVSGADLVEAVVAVGRGGTALDPAVMASLMRRVRTSDTELNDDAEHLTQREIEVLRKVATGRSNRAVAEELAVSPRTIEAHLHHAFKKLGADSRTQAVVLAARRGLIELDGGDA